MFSIPFNYEHAPLIASAYQAAMWFAVIVPLALAILIYYRPAVNGGFPLLA